ncbi:hypothetical protein VC83_01832 [Pseudogymnoascus destructans]|uniref:Uncharacterized protein n=1 Tax=Pseudogymnoascus destructans TaxID=655981 RepID=A0A177AH22_9PEZI|nr:uncharacterized protein VC83_01832 [Pseudogymnoascus destructans]OAF61407.1 hypothetical protein VC83_01832 [Pseudogymnoascus destructans]
MASIDHTHDLAVARAPSMAAATPPQGSNAAPNNQTPGHPSFRSLLTRVSTAITDMPCEKSPLRCSKPGRAVHKLRSLLHRMQDPDAKAQEDAGCCCWQHAPEGLG